MLYVKSSALVNFMASWWPNYKWKRSYVCLICCLVSFFILEYFYLFCDGSRSASRKLTASGDTGFCLHSIAKRITGDAHAHSFSDVDLLMEANQAPSKLPRENGLLNISVTKRAQLEPPRFAIFYFLEILEKFEKVFRCFWTF